MRRPGSASATSRGTHALGPSHSSSASATRARSSHSSSASGTQARPQSLKLGLIHLSSASALQARHQPHELGTSTQAEPQPSREGARDSHRSRAWTLLPCTSEFFFGLGNGGLQTARESEFWSSCYGRIIRSESRDVHHGSRIGVLELMLWSYNQI
ncbi:unnamed protein product [Cuscuta campestris]|uniref:Uncharacterized protein n=1 Tax=Cuscuta campestris TaxID=132261 RepID=A0A484KPU1_9ASTE|nr:unnamed protein product [Cuscuta campestris]